VKVNVREGQQVVRGQVLAELDATDWEHQVAKAKASLDLALAEKRRVEQGASEEERSEARWRAKVAEVESNLHRSTFQRWLQLKDSGAITAEDLEEAEARYNSGRAQWAAARARAAELEAPPRSHDLQRANAEIALARAKLGEAEATLAKAQLRAPSNGIVLEIDGEVGELAGPESEHPLITIVDVSELRVRAYVEERDAVHVCEGQRAYVTADGMSGKKFWGEAVACLPLMQPKSQFSNRPDERSDVKVREVLIRLDANQSTDRLVVGLPLDVHFEFSESQADESKPGRAPRGEYQVANSD
jgi:multidrug resistance efflux pump